MIPIRRSSLRHLSLVATAAAVGCGHLTTLPKGPARLRVVNATFEITNPAVGAASAIAHAIDVLIDSSSTSPGVAGLAPASLTSGTPGPHNQQATAGYRDISIGVHTMAARLSGLSPTGASFFTTASDGDYLPKQYFTVGTPYTLIIAGLAADTGHVADSAFAGSGGTVFPLLVDDPFYPPKANGVYQARLQLINAAPFADASGQGAPVTLYITPGTTPPTLMAGDTAARQAPYRGRSPYLNENAGSYTLTAASGPTGTEQILAQQSIVLHPGEVWTYVLLSTAYSATPSVANHHLLAMIDSQW